MIAFARPLAASVAVLALAGSILPAQAVAPAAPAPAPAAPAPKVTLTTLEPGEGPRPTREDIVLVAYKGMLADGTVFDSSEATPMPVGQVVPGFADGLVQMQRKGRYKLLIPAALAYGAEGGGPIPPNADLTFEVTLLDFKTMDEYRAMIEQARAAQAATAGNGQDAAPAGQ